MVDSSRPPRVLLVVNSLGFGGTERMIERMTLHLTASGQVRYTILSLEDEGPIGARLRAAGVEVLALGHRGALRQVLGGALAIRRMIRAGSVDLVHTFLYRSHCAGRVARLGVSPRTPLVSSERCLGDNRGLLTRQVNRLTSRWSDRVLVVSRAVGERTAQRDGVPRDRVAVVPNGIEAVESDPRSRARLRRVLRLGGDEALLLYLGRLHREKGPDLLVTALEALQRRLPDGWRCVFIGDGPERGQVRAAVKTHGLADRVFLMGARSRVGPWIDACDALVVPSREEGMPVAAIEAMMRGRPVVASRVGGTPEVVLDGDTGILVPPEDPAALGTALARLIGDSGLRRRMGGRGREVARACFSLERMAEGTLHEYERLLPGERAVSAAGGVAAARVR